MDTAIRIIVRIVFALLLLSVAAFCVFGFLSSYEISDTSGRLPWQIGYGTLGLICLGGAGFVLRPRRRGGDE